MIYNYKPVSDHMPYDLLDISHIIMDYPPQSDMNIYIKKNHLIEYVAL